LSRAPHWLIDALLPDWPALTAADRAEVLRHTTEFMGRQIALAPFHIRLGFGGLLLAFRCYSLVRLGSPNLASRAARNKTLAEFSALLPLASGLERLLRSMTVLVFLEEPIVLAALGEPTGADRQSEYRRRRHAIADAT
jgi:hypothetical protein